MKKRRAAMMSIPKPKTPVSKKKAELCIETNIAPFANTEFTSGHTWLSLNEGTKSTTYDTMPNGRYEDSSVAKGSDIRRNGKLDYESRSKYCTPVSPEQIQQFKKSVQKPKEWSETDNCTSWATDSFNAVSGKNLDADDGWAFGAETPRALADDIAKTKKKETGASNPARADKPSTLDRIRRMGNDLKSFAGQVGVAVGASDYTAEGDVEPTSSKGDHDFRA